MNRTTTPLFASLIFGLLGMLMSGYLSYWVLFGPSCNAGPISWLSCGATQPVKLIGVPTCVYGFFMFAIIVGLSLAALQRFNRSLRRALMVVGLFGMAFSFGLSIYELFWLKWTTLPACVYGFFFYLGIVISIGLSRVVTPAVTPPTETTPLA